MFEDRPERETVVLYFYGDQTKVPSLAFSFAIKDMKALLMENIIPH